MPLGQTQMVLSSLSPDLLWGVRLKVAAVAAAASLATLLLVTPRVRAAELSPGFSEAAVDPAIARPGDLLESGVASWYGRAWKGRRTASGVRYNPEAMTAASHTLPLGTRVLVTLEGTARSVLVTITDHQGAAHRVIDLSLAAARQIGMLGRGTAQVILHRA